MSIVKMWIVLVVISASAIQDAKTQAIHTSQGTISIEQFKGMTSTWASPPADECIILGLDITDSPAWITYLRDSCNCKRRVEVRAVVDGESFDLTFEELKAALRAARTLPVHSSPTP